MHKLGINCEIAPLLQAQKPSRSIMGLVLARVGKDMEAPGIWANEMVPIVFWDSTHGTELNVLCRYS